MSVADLFTRNLPREAEELLSSEDRQQINSFANAIDSQITEKINDFRKIAGNKVAELAEQDFVSEFETKLALERKSQQEVLDKAKLRLETAKSLIGAITQMEIGQGTSEALEKLQSSINALEDDVQKAEENAKNFGSNLGKTIGGSVRAAVKLIL